MDHEALIYLKLENQETCVLVSSPQFPLLHLIIESASDDAIKKCVFPVLKEMVEFKVGGHVALRLVDSFREGTADAIVPPHVIASRIAA